MKWYDILWKLYFRSIATVCVCFSSLTPQIHYIDYKTFVLIFAAAINILSIPYNNKCSL